MEIMGTKGIVSDNDLQYLLFLKAFILHADPDATIKIYKHEDKVTVIVDPAYMGFREHVLKNILSLHKMFGIKTDFSKSTNISRKLIFNITI